MEAYFSFPSIHESKIFMEYFLKIQLMMKWGYIYMGQKI
jgi:hypothetical protein